jgi:hypothetical protein
MEIFFRVSVSADAARRQSNWEYPQDILRPRILRAKNGAFPMAAAPAEAKKSPNLAERIKEWGKNKTLKSEYESIFHKTPG